MWRHKTCWEKNKENQNNRNCYWEITGFNHYLSKTIWIVIALNSLIESYRLGCIKKPNKTTKNNPPKQQQQKENQTYLYAAFMKYTSTIILHTNCNRKAMEMEMEGKQE